MSKGKSTLRSLLAVLAIPLGFWLLTRATGLALLWAPESAWVKSGGTPVGEIKAADVVSPTTGQIGQMRDLMKIWPAMTETQQWSLAQPWDANPHMLEDALVTFEPVIRWAAEREDALWLTFSVTSERMETESFDTRLLGQAEADRRTALWKEISEALPETGMEGFVMPSRQIVRMLGAKAIFAARKDDRPAAATALSLALRLGHAARQKAGLADAWQYGEDLRETLGTVRTIWKDGGEELGALEAALQREDLMKQYASAQRFEGSSRLYLLGSASQRDAWQNGMQPFWQWLSFHFAYAVRQHDLAQLLKAYNGLLSGTGRPVVEQETAWPVLSRGLSVNLEDMDYFGDAKSLRCLGDAEAQRRMALAAIELRRIKAAAPDGKYPSAFDAPVSPLDGKKMEYESDGSRFTLRNNTPGCGGREVAWTWN